MATRALYSGFRRRIGGASCTRFGLELGETLFKQTNMDHVTDYMVVRVPEDLRGSTYKQS